MSRSTTGARNSTGRRSRARSMSARAAGALRVRRAGREGSGQVGILYLFETGRRPAGSPSQLVDRRVHGYPVHPGGEPAAAIETVQPADDGDEGILGGVSGVGVVAGEAAAHRVHPVIVGPQQRLEGAAVTQAGQLDERPVVAPGIVGDRLSRPATRSPSNDPHRSDGAPPCRDTSTFTDGWTSRSARRVP